MALRHPPNIDSNHPKYLYLIFTGPPLNIYQIFMNIPLKLVAPRCFGSSGFRHFWVTLTRNCRKFCFQQDARPVCGARPAPSRDLCLYKLAIPIIILFPTGRTTCLRSQTRAISRLVLVQACNSHYHLSLAQRAVRVIVRNS